MILLRSVYENALLRKLHRRRTTLILVIFSSTFSEFQWVHVAQDHCGRFRKLEPKKDDVAAVAYGILLQYPFDENNIFEMTTFITLDKRLVVVFSRKCG